MNAKIEFLNHIADIAKVLCAEIELNNTFDKSEPVLVGLLKVNYTEDDWNNFLELLDFEYDDGFGAQELFGTIWFTDGTWSDRFEYDGSEYWDYHMIPDIPDYLK